MADLEPLIRLRRHVVDEKQKALAELFREAEALEARKASLLEELDRERRALDETQDLQAAAHYGLYADGVRKNIGQLDSELSKLDVRIGIIQDDIRTAFAELKRIEIVDQNRKEAIKKEIEMKEANELDEIGIEIFRRQED